MSILFPPAGGGAAGATSLRDLWMAPTQPASLGQLVASNLATDYLEGSGLLDKAIMTINHDGVGMGSAFDALHGLHSIHDPGGFANDDAFYQGNQVVRALPGSEFLMKFKTQTESFTRRRAGLISTAAGPGLAGAPATIGEGAALIWDPTAASAVSFFFYSASAVSQQQTNTGITAADNTTYYIRIRCRSSQVNFELYDADFVSLATAEHTTFFPSDTQLLRPTYYTVNIANAGRVLRMYYMNVLSYQTD